MLQFAPVMAGMRLRRRLRMLHDDPKALAASPDELEKLVARQMEGWEQRGPLRHAVSESTLRDLSLHSWSVFVFQVRGGRIGVLPKPYLAVRRADQRLYAHSRRIFGTRAMQCRVYLEHVLERAGNTACFDLAFDAADDPRDSADFPIFSLNKNVSARNVLLPDTDFFDFDWYTNDRDPFSYDAKTVSACFVGSSTGGNLITHDKVRDRAAPRLRAAARFHGHPEVTFRISGALACESPAVERYMREQPWFGAYVPWQEQLGHRFLISMDGHGAAWSRVVRSLRSNGVLLKYDSSMITFYYPALEPGRDYLPVGEDADIPRIVAEERANPGRFRPVAEAGNAFARKFLNPASVSVYTRMLLARFADAY